MKHFKNTARIGAIAAAAALSLTACVGGAESGGTPPGSEPAGLPQSIKDSGTLRVGTSADFPPMESREGDKLVGVDVELQENSVKFLA